MWVTEAHCIHSWYSILNVCNYILKVLHVCLRICIHLVQTYLIKGAELICLLKGCDSYPWVKLCPFLQICMLSTLVAYLVKQHARYILEFIIWKHDFLINISIIIWHNDCIRTIYNLHGCVCKIRFIIWQRNEGP